MFIIVLCKMMLSQDSFKHEKKGRSTSKLIAILVFFKMTFVLEPNYALMEPTVWGGESAWWPVLPQDHMAIRHFWEYAHFPWGLEDPSCSVNGGIVNSRCGPNPKSRTAKKFPNILFFKYLEKNPSRGMGQHLFDTC